MAGCGAMPQEDDDGDWRCDGVVYDKMVRGDRRCDGVVRGKVLRVIRIEEADIKIRG